MKQVTAGARQNMGDPQSLDCTMLSSFKPSQSKANQDKKNDQVKEISSVLRMPAPPGDVTGSKNLFLKLHRA